MQFLISFLVTLAAWFSRLASTTSALADRLARIRADRLRQSLLEAEAAQATCATALATQSAAADEATTMAAANDQWQAPLRQVSHTIQLVRKSIPNPPANTSTWAPKLVSIPGGKA